MTSGIISTEPLLKAMHSDVYHQGYQIFSGASIGFAESLICDWNDIVRLFLKLFYESKRSHLALQ